MDLYATFPRPLRARFGYLADPSRLGDWLPDVSGRLTWALGVAAGLPG
jgi:hypothetical protein